MNGRDFAAFIDGAAIHDGAFDKALRDASRRHRRAMRRLAEAPVPHITELLRSLDLAGDEIRRLRRRVSDLEFMHVERYDLRAAAFGKLPAEWHA